MHSWVFQRPQIFWSLWKTHSCMLYSNCTRNHAITYTKIYCGLQPPAITRFRLCFAYFFVFYRRGSQLSSTSYALIWRWISEEYPELSSGCSYFSKFFLRYCTDKRCFIQIWRQCNISLLLKCAPLITVNGLEMYLNYSIHKYTNVEKCFAAKTEWFNADF
jgi:hypothetical protein